jgi:hypothetical protein
MALQQAKDVHAEVDSNTKSGHPFALPRNFDL